MPIFFEIPIHFFKLIKKQREAISLLNPFCSVKKINLDNLPTQFFIEPYVFGCGKNIRLAPAPPLDEFVNQNVQIYLPSGR